MDSGALVSFPFRYPGQRSMGRKLARGRVQWQDQAVARCFIYPLLSGLLLLAGCSTALRPESVSYQYRQSMISDDLEPEAPVSRRRQKKIRRPRSDPNAAARRCRQLRGRRMGGGARAALRLIKRCLRRSLPARVLRGRGVELRLDAPRPGDLVLFHNTRDRNNNGRSDDRFTATGVVVGRSAERVEFVYLRDRRVQLGVLNLSQPNRRRLRGRRVENSYLRIIQPADPPRTRYLAGQLLAGFTTPLAGK